MRALSTLLIAVFAASCVPAGGAPPTYTMWLKAHPQAIVADGRSETTISAEVRDATGRPVPDGTTVDFTSSIGTIERTARTVAGVARVRLQSSVTVGTAMVSAVATVGNAVAQLRVDFLEPGTELFDESFITVASKKYLGYDAGGGVVDAAGGVDIAHRGLTIHAEEAQVDVRSNILRAKCKMGADNIILRRESKSVEASALYYDFNSMTGVLLAPASEGARRMTFRGRDLFVQPATEDADQTRGLDYKPVTEASMFVKAASLVIRPGEEIKFKRAVFYMDGTRMLSVPLYVINLKGGASGTSQMLSYGTDGIRMDLPFYYSLTPTSTGALRLRRSEPGGWGYYSGRPGWQLDLEQDYNSGGSTEGSFLLNRITSASDWGARWTQRREFDNDAQVYTYIDFPAHRSLFGSMNYTRSLPRYTLSVNGRASKMTGAPGSIASDAYIQSRPKSIMGGALSYSLTSKVSLDSRNSLGSGCGFQLYGRPIKAGALGSISTSVLASRNWGPYGGTTMTANAGVYRTLGGSGGFGMDYSYSWGSGTSNYSAHRLSANLSVSPSAKWNAYAYATAGLTDRSVSAFGSLSYNLASVWRLGVLGTYQKFGDYSYPDVEVALARSIGKQEIDLIWSSANRRFRVEFSALNF